MASPLFSLPTVATTPNYSLPCSKRSAINIRAPTLNLVVSYRSICYPKRPIRFLTISRPFSLSNPQSLDEDEEESEQGLVQDLRIPDHWLVPSKALEESKWLRATLHKWLDDEYCPEATNVEISKVAAKSYYESLVAMQADLGEILLKMASDLESISYQESFHGAFSAANAAVHLIVLRIGQG